MEGVERDRPLGGLAGGLADLGRLDAVVGRVADHVDQRIAQLVDHPLVQLRLLAVDHQVDALAVAVGDVADDALEAGEQRPDGHHPRVHHALLDAVADPIELVDRLEQVVERAAGLAEHGHVLADRLQVVAQAAGLGAQRGGVRRAIRLTAGALVRGRHPAPACPAPAEDLQRMPAAQRAFEPLADLGEAGLVDHQLAGQIHQLVEPLDVDPQGLRRLGVVGGAAFFGRFHGGRRRRHRGRHSRRQASPRARAGWPCGGETALLPAAASRSTATRFDARNLQPLAEGLRRLGRVDGEGDLAKFLHLVQLLGGRLEIAHLAGTGQFFIDQPGLQSDQGQRRLEECLAHQRGFRLAGDGGDLGMELRRDGDPALPRRRAGRQSCPARSSSWAKRPSAAEEALPCLSPSTYCRRPSVQASMASTIFAESVPPLSTRCCTRSSMRCANLAARFKPIEAAEPLMRWDVISRVSMASGLPRRSMAKRVSLSWSREMPVSSMKIGRYLAGDFVVLQAGKTIAGGGRRGRGRRGWRRRATATRRRPGPRRAGRAGVVQRLLRIRLRGLQPFRSRALQQARNAVDDRLALDRRAGGLLERGNEASQQVDGLEDQLDDVAVQGQFVFAGGVEDVFDLVRQGVDFAQSEHGREALEAVGGAEHFVEEFLVAAPWAGLIVGAADPLVELQKVLVEAVEQLSRLVEEIAQQVVEDNRRGGWPGGRSWESPFTVRVCGAARAGGVESRGPNRRCPRRLR